MNLIIITHDIENESFLRNELDVIAGNFEKVVVITTQKRAPLESRLYDIIVSRKKDFFIASAFYALGKLLSKEFFEELRQRKKMMVKPSFKTIVLGCIASWMIERRLKGYFLKIWKGDQIVLYSYWLNTYAYFVAKIKKNFPHIQAVSRAHRFEVDDKENYIPFRKTIDSFLDKIIFISEYTNTKYNALMKQRAGSIRAEQKVMYLGVNNVFNPKNLHDLSSTFNVVSCSAIHKRKRLDLMIEGLSLLPKSINIRWVHFGTGTDYEKVLNYASKKLSRSSVSFEFAGHVSNNKILQYYRTNPVDLFVNTSDDEGIPVSIMEAMSFGIPCIARDVGGNKEIVKDGISGKLLPNNVLAIHLANALNSTYLLKKNKRKSYDDLRLSTYSYWKTRFNASDNYNKFFDYISN